MTLSETTLVFIVLAFLFMALACNPKSWWAGLSMVCMVVAVGSQIQIGHAIARALWGGGH